MVAGNGRSPDALTRARSKRKGEHAEEDCQAGQAPGQLPPGLQEVHPGWLLSQPCCMTHSSVAGSLLLWAEAAAMSSARHVPAASLTPHVWAQCGLGTQGSICACCACCAVVWLVRWCPQPWQKQQPCPPPDVLRFSFCIAAFGALLHSDAGLACACGVHLLLTESKLQAVSESPSASSHQCQCYCPSQRPGGAHSPK